MRFFKFFKFFNIDSKPPPAVVPRFCALANCKVWFPDDGPACPNHEDLSCALHGSTDTGG